VIGFALFGNRLNAVTAVFCLLLASLVLTGTAWVRGAEYDEGYTVFLADGVPRPAWPERPFRAGEVRGYFEGHSTPLRIAEHLRESDVHPPLYFWGAAAWRAVAGSGLFRLRLFSVLCALASLLAVAAIAANTGVPPAAAMLLTLSCYAFSYTAMLARGFALAQALSLAAVALLALAARRKRVMAALGGGILLGLATFTNYLTAFVALAALLWLLLARWRRPALWLPAGAAFAAFLPADLVFFLAQRESRVGQFPPFHLLASLVRLAHYAGAAIFGGLPLYVPGLAGPGLGAVLALLLICLGVLIVVRWRRIGDPEGRLLLAMAALAPPVGLLALGAAFNNTPIELRYLAFATPFFALLLAGALGSLAPRGRAALASVVLTVQAAALAGLAFMPQTMQPQTAATREAAALAGPDGLVIVPRGDDGVGLVGAMVQSAPDWLRLLAIPSGADPAAIRARSGTPRRVVLAMLGVDGASRATLPAMEAAFRDQPCWRAAGGGRETVAFERVPGCGRSASD
jgi:4-amino-4-deoxy-L-arabinose transferase-like glycosyltransferase